MPDGSPILTLREATFAGPIPLGTAWLLAECMELRGKQEMWERHKPEVLIALREQAVVQSVESSNRIEGVTVEADRLRPLVLGKSRPRDKSEEELAGYRRGLDWIFAGRERTRSTPRGAAVTAGMIQHLHELAFGMGEGVHDAGRWKSRDNEIIEVQPGGRRRVRFVPTSAEQTPAAVSALCAAYEGMGVDGRVPALLVIGTMMFDLLCIHPFRDGNGRVSRLLTTMLLERHGFIVARFVSLEKLVEESRGEYYEVLERCSRGWAEGTNEIVPWWNFFLGIVRRGYAELEEKVERSGNRGTKADLVRAAVLRREGRFTLKDVGEQVPGCSGALVRKVLQVLKGEGKVRLEGRGRGAWWEVVDR